MAKPQKVFKMMDSEARKFILTEDNYNFKAPQKGTDQNHLTDTQKRIVKLHNIKKTDSFKNEKTMTKESEKLKPKVDTTKQAVSPSS